MRRWRCFWVLALLAVSPVTADAEEDRAYRAQKQLERWHPHYDNGLHLYERSCGVEAFPMRILAGPPVTLKTFATINVTIFKNLRHYREVSIVLGFSPRAASSISASIDEINFDLAVTEKTVNFNKAKLASDWQVDAFLRALREGEYLTIAGVDESGQPKARVYTLEGFEDSIRDVMKNCLRDPDVGWGKFKRNRA